MKYLALHLIPLLFGIRKSAKSVILAGVALATVPCVSTVSGQDSLSRDLLAHWPLDGDLKDAYGAFDGVFRGTDQIQFERGVLDLGLQLDGFDQYVVIEPETEDNFDFQGRVPVSPNAKGYSVFSRRFNECARESTSFPSM